MTGPLADLDLATLVAFTGGAFVAVSAVVFVSGHFPRHRAPATAGGPLLGSVLAYCALAALLSLLAILAVVAVELPLAVAVVAAGLAVLGAPFLVDPLPNTIRESRLGLIAAFGLCAATAFAIQTNIVL
ncbi:hypothetical protein [Jiella marina]|uniref:hypothetical protein n=1 Tax=Jiella sp. LLJ827 TaxID=2917712 RepID=UPI002101C26E|nr:hypothetical protein [Jiella sp. LLJ827]MCQ0986080.1 hypothetical protein [Jiella sp. LLJ827]